MSFLLTFSFVSEDDAIIVACNTIGDNIVDEVLCRRKEMELKKKKRVTKMMMVVNQHLYQTVRKL